MSKEFNDAMAQVKNKEKVTKYVPDSRIEAYILASINKEGVENLPYPQTHLEELFCLLAARESIGFNCGHQDVLVKVGNVEKQLFGTYDGTAIDITGNGTIDIESMLDELKLPLKVNVNVAGAAEDTKALIDLMERDITELTIADGTTSIGDYALYNCQALKNITIPNSVAEIGESAFKNCFSLTSIDIPNGIVSIKPNTFYGCNSLTSATIPNSVVKITSQAFYQCTSLSNIIIPSNVTDISSSAFDGCTSLTYLEIPASVTSIGNYALKIGSSSKKTTIKFLGSNAPSVSSNAINKSYLNKILIPRKGMQSYLSSSGINYYKDYWEYYGPGFESVIEGFELLKGNSQSVTINLVDFESVPTVSVTSNNINAVTISDIVTTQSAITFNVNSVGEGDVTIAVKAELGGEIFESTFAITAVGDIYPEITIDNYDDYFDNGFSYIDNESWITSDINDQGNYLEWGLSEMASGCVVNVNVTEKSTKSTLYIDYSLYNAGDGYDEACLYKLDNEEETLVVLTEASEELHTAVYENIPIGEHKIRVTYRSYDGSWTGAFKFRLRWE